MIDILALIGKGRTIYVIINLFLEDIYNEIDQVYYRFS